MRDMSMDQAHEYLMAKTGQLAFRDKENGYATGIKQFIDDKSYRPGLQPYARPAEEAGDQETLTPSASPLDGLRVLDLGTMVTAPLAAMLLGQLGAEVTKVEHPDGRRPVSQDDGRRIQPEFHCLQSKQDQHPDRPHHSRRAEHVCSNWWQRADILIENFRSGVMDRLGLDARG